MPCTRGQISRRRSVLEAADHNLVWFVTGCSRGYRFDLGSKLLEVLKELAGDQPAKYDTPDDYPARFWRIGPYGLVKAGVCEGNPYIAVHGADSRDLIRE